MAWTSTIYLGIMLLLAAGYYVYLKFYKKSGTVWGARLYIPDNNEIPPRFKKKRVKVKGTNIIKDVVVTDKDNNPVILEETKGLHRLRLVGFDKIIVERDKEKGKDYYKLEKKDVYLPRPTYPCVEFEKDNDYVDLLYIDGHWHYLTKAVSKNNISKIDVLPYDTQEMRDLNKRRLKDRYTAKAKFWDKYGTMILMSGMAIIFLIAVIKTYEHNETMANKWFEEAEEQRAKDRNLIMEWITKIGNPNPTDAPPPVQSDQAESDAAHQEQQDRMKEE